ncbi:hypothetical protein L3Q82_010401 [Scortum barcoo]|uniref:Uncharacterized protein n=1 Tax=Scortum barcoo TaxID=214431 RepID=A0ACB8WC24_9TELE|nr:hypothetical protein L3Q82_010401 [Scortum barcoo]
MFSASIVDAGSSVRSCGRKVSGACRGWQPPNPVVDTGSSKGCRQAEEGVLSDHVGLWDSWLTQLTGTGRPSRSRRPSDGPGGKNSGLGGVRAGGELLTATGDIVGRWKKYFEDLLNPTDLPSNEEAEAGDSEVDSSHHPSQV